MKNDQRGLAHVLPVIVVAIIGIVSLVGYRVYKGAQQSENSAKISAGQESKVATINGDLSDIKSLDEIQKSVANEAGDTAITGVDLEDEDGATMYKVKLSDGRVVKVDARSGRVSGVEQGESSSETQSIAISSSYIGFLRARQIASDSHPGSSIRKVGLEMESGAVVYSVRFIDDARVDINATSGQIVRSEADDDATSSSSSHDSTTNKISSSSSGKASSGGSSGNSSSKGGSSDDQVESHDSQPQSQPAAPSTSAGISQSAALEIANNRLPGRTLKAVETEVEDGATVYSIRYKDGGRVDIRVSDGVVVRVDE